VLPSGGMRYRECALDTDTAHDLFYRAAAIADEVHSYMELLDSAPPLKAQELDEPYKLAELKGYVLGGLEGKHGVQFTTWMQDYDRRGVTLGHYFGSDYTGAKQDFAIRCGLAGGEKVFTPEQLTEISRCCADTLDSNYSLTYAQEELLHGIQAQIEKLVPDLECRLQERSTSMQQGMNWTSTRCGFPALT